MWVELILVWVLQVLFPRSNLHCPTCSFRASSSAANPASSENQFWHLCRVPEILSHEVVVNVSADIEQLHAALNTDSRVKDV